MGFYVYILWYSTPPPPLSPSNSQLLATMGIGVVIGSQRKESFIRLIMLVLIEIHTSH